MTWNDAYIDFEKSLNGISSKILANKQEIIVLRKKREVVKRIMYLIKKEEFAKATALMKTPETEKLFGIVNEPII